MFFPHLCFFSQPLLPSCRFLGRSRGLWRQEVNPAEGCCAEPFSPTSSEKPLKKCSRNRSTSANPTGRSWQENWDSKIHRYVTLQHQHAQLYFFFLVLFFIIFPFILLHSYQSTLIPIFFVKSKVLGHQT